MPSSIIAANELPAPRLDPAARGPLAGLQAPSPPRKRPQSVRVDGSLWVSGTPSSQPETHAWRAPNLAQMVLPRPAVPGNRWTLLTHVATDFLLVFVNFAIASHLHVGLHKNLLWLTRSPEMPLSRFGFVLLYGSLLTLLAYSEGLYRTDLERDSPGERLALLRTVGWSTVLAIILIHLLGIKLALPLAPVLACAISTFFSMVAWRSLQRRYVARRTQQGRASRNVLIVGAGRLGRRIAAYLEQNEHLGRVVRGFLDENWTLGADVLGTTADLAQVARAEFVDEIILAATAAPATSRNVIGEARRMGIDVKLVPEMFGCESRSPIPENFGELPVLTLYEEPIHPGGIFLKRMFDIVGSLLGLVLMAPALIFIGLLIRLESPGPILYRGPRAGRKGRCFLCYKYRTMLPNADACKQRLRAQNQREGPFFKIGDDPRITRVGRVLRRYSLDELPQLWNVLKGEMSLVGPRPHPLDDFALYELDHLRRLEATPGLTGLWQVTARQDPSFARNLALDREYIENWSLGMDLRILLKTFSAVLRGSGA